jgi:outer membrane receptor protein involved in Fe transport
VVYVDDIRSPSSIVGFRDGNTWYNAEGVEISNPDILRTSSGIAPLLVDKDRVNSSEINVDGFEDYKPQTTFMPRIAFSFPISDEANFFAHYDILTKRPTGGRERLDPTDYLYLSSTGGQTVRNNPNLKPEKTIDYEIGFQQKISQSSAIKLSGFYREMRDQVQIVRRKQAFPREYNTLDNVDFGTVKGVTVSYDLRRTGNVSLKASYTLQFAEGTGSDQTTALSLINAGKDNLKVTTPYTFDQRHALQAVFDFRYGEGKDYNGPIMWDRQVLNRVGLNLTANLGSGVPYSGQTTSSGNGFTSDAGNKLLNGSINGNRLPWNYRLDARIDKDFTVKVGKDKNKSLDCTVYLQILNVLNTRNVVGVYRFTGDPEDDGYLNDPTWLGDVQAQNDTQSFSEMYGIKTSIATNYNVPRRTRLGIRVSF